jgi:glycerol-3-phosphate dehydrogenase (NAD(P)+)
MTGTLNKIFIVGAGAWGTALAKALADAGRDITLYARSAHLAEAVNKVRRNPLYLPDVILNSAIRATHDPAAAKDAQLILLVTPAQFLRGTLKLFRPHLPPGAPLVNCAKGIEAATGKLLSEVIQEETPEHPCAILSGPNFAAEVARGLPAAATLATTSEGGPAWAEALHTRALRPYLSDDVTGAEISGAVKNVIAIACGIVEGKGLGQNARAAVMTRGMAEICRLGAAKGAKAETFLGLSGLGDLTLTCNSMNSRNFSLGAEIGAGKNAQDILKSRRTVAEGVETARAVAKMAEEAKTDMPICRAVDHILHGGGAADEVIAGLLSRVLKNERG